MYFATFALPIYLGGSFYTGLRLYQFLKLYKPSVKRWIYWVCFISFSGLLLALRNLIPVSGFARFIGNLYNVYLALMLLSLFYLALFDFVRLIFFMSKKIPSDAMKKAKLTRLSGIIVVSCITLTFLGGYINARTIRIKNYDISVNKTCGIETLKIAMFADTHIGYGVGKVHIRNLVDKINEQKPDIVLITGDMFDTSLDNIADIDEINSIFAEIDCRYGVYAVLGNHDKLTVQMENFFRKCGITLLLDDYVLVEDEFYIAGRADPRVVYGVGQKRVDLEEFAREIDNGKPVIVLDHQPLSIEETEEFGADILLSGHTHKGQVFPASLITNAIYEIDYGYGQFGPTHMVVTSGVGYWGPPMRIMTGSELVMINVTFNG